MGTRAFGPWHVKKNGETVSILGADSSVVAVLPVKGPDDTSWVAQAYVMAAAPQLLEICTQVKSVLENNLVVTTDGFKINCSEIQVSLLDALLRAAGCRKLPDEP